MTERFVMKPDYIARFEKMGMGLFVHFGLYSILGKGEWHYVADPKCDKKQYMDELIHKFKVKKNWAKDLVKAAKAMGCKYITLTTKHHEGFALYDTCGLNEFDAPHSATHRDLVKEFVDECNKAGIMPMFYHALLDWWHPDYYTNFPAYIDYLVKSVEILCKNYGKIGGFWFDGKWDKPNEDWQEDRLFGTIRKYQPEAMIINNTGLSALGETGHPEIDSVTFERGKPFKVVSSKGKEVAGEVCDSLTEHWGYCPLDLTTKSPKYLISELIDCRANNCNFLINSGPRSDGSLNPVEKEILKQVGVWIKANGNFIYNAHSCEIEATNATILFDGKYYYAIAKDVPLAMFANITREGDFKEVVLSVNKKIKGAIYMDTKEKVELKTKNSFVVKPFEYGRDLFARVIRFKL